MAKERKNFEDITLGVVAGISSFIRGILNAGDKMEDKFQMYSSTYIILMFTGAIMLANGTFARNVYRDRIEAEEKLKSVEAYYIDSKSKFESATLNSKIMEEVIRRDIKLKQSGNAPIIIE